MDKANRNEATRKHPPLPYEVTARMSKAELRQRRRVGVDTRRQQRIAVSRFKEAERLVPALERVAAAAKRLRRS